jgi:exopolysaccharide biosynthesis polyprenyl glycosylphosphotransferase
MNVTQPAEPMKATPVVAPAVESRTSTRPDSSFWFDVIIAAAVIGDLLFFLTGMVLAFYGRLSLNSTVELTALTFPIRQYIGHFIFGTTLFLVLSARMGTYSVNNVLRIRQIFIAEMNTAVLWAACFLFLSLLFSVKPPISRIFVILSAILGLALVLGWRWLLRWIIQTQGITRKLRKRLVVVGWNVEATKLAEAIRRDSNHPYEIIGCLPSAFNEYRIEPPPEIPKLGEYHSIVEIHQQKALDIVLIGDLNPHTREIIALSEFCQREMIQFKIIPTYFQILISGLHLETISGVPVLGVEKLPLDSLSFRALKRLMDVAGALLGLLLTAPLIVIFGCLVYYESPGPIFYRQQRMGRGGQLFGMYKIRSMALDAEKDGAQWAQPNDARRLKIGAFIREWNIDETPQFLNVLRGEMSLVGPRPERPELIEDFKDQIRHYNARHNIKPGMTGWAQIHGLRGNTDLNERIRYDLYYLENWTPVLDIYIMIMTFFKNRNAY